MRRAAPKNAETTNAAPKRLDEVPEYCLAMEQNEKLQKRQQEARAQVKELTVQLHSTPPETRKAAEWASKVAAALGEAKPPPSTADQLKEAIGEMDAVDQTLREQQDHLQQVHTDAMRRVRETYLPEHLVVGRRIRSMVIALAKAVQEERDFWDRLQREGVDWGGPMECVTFPFGTEDLSPFHAWLKETAPYFDAKPPGPGDEGAARALGPNGRNDAS